MQILIVVHALQKYIFFLILSKYTSTITNHICAPQNDQNIISKIHLKKTLSYQNILPLFKKEGEITA